MLTPEEIRDIVKDEMAELFEQDYEDFMRAFVLGVLKQVGLDKWIEASRKPQ